MTEITDYKLITFQDGSKTLVTGIGAHRITITIDDNPVVDEVVDSVEKNIADDMREKLAANETNLDTMMENTSIMEKTQTPPTEEIEVI